MATSPPSPQRTTLYFRQGGSDKVYHVSIEPQDGGFVVNFAFGRRGATLQTGAKTTRPVPFDRAKTIYDKLVKEKTGKGYTPGDDGTPYAQTDRADRCTGVVPQLLNPIDEAQAEALMASDQWWMQEKFDGRRVLIRKKGEKLLPINRSGLTTALSLPIVEAIQLLSAADCLLDGEAIGDMYVAFDLLEKNGVDMKASPYAVRHCMLMDLADGVQSDGLRYAETVSGADAKRLMLAKLKREKKEGAVFKDSTAPYSPGRPASGGAQVKLKFYATASCIVAGVHGAKRSVALELIGSQGNIAVGNVTIPANHAIPSAGAVVEIRYLYAYPGGSLYQPMYLGAREDIRRDSCRIEQLKFKVGEAGEDV